MQANPTPDEHAKALLDRGDLSVDLDTGAITRRNGKRAEVLDKAKGYGRVCVGRNITAMAHRVVWIAAHGLIPPGLQINHINRRRWDNRLANLELVTPQGQCRHWQGLGYESIGDREPSVPVEWIGRYDRGEQTEQVERRTGSGKVIRFI